MTIGNTAAITVSAAAMAAAPKVDDCKELEKQNEDRRKTVEDTTADKRMVSKNGMDDQEGTTISSCKFQPAGGDTAQCASAHSSGRAHEMMPSQFVEGGSEEVRSGQEPVLCSGDQTHRPPYKQKSGHAEARILDQAIGKQKGAKLVFKIDWRPSSGGRSNLPCPACQRLMCIAMKECDHEIWLCDDDNKPQKLTEKECGADKDGNITPSAQNALAKKMGAV
ncbi:MAG: hypothetical protein HY855_05720 [Burkholderiales bacterium]|nr:hypothetical protein [Burkholderiales bacterium]